MNRKGNILTVRWSLSQQFFWVLSALLLNVLFLRIKRYIWRKIHINKEEEDGEEFLCVFLVCDAYKSTRWSADVWHVQYLCHYNDAKHDICEDLVRIKIVLLFWHTHTQISPQGTNTFKYDSNTNLYGSSMLKWSELRNEENVSAIISGLLHPSELPGNQYPALFVDWAFLEHTLFSCSINRSITSMQKRDLD